MAGASHAHPTPKDYWILAVILAVITAAEVAVAYVDMPGLVVTSLIVLMIAKFAIVVGWYMHLRYESATARRLFYIGLIAAPLLFGAVLFSFGVLIG